MIGWPSSVLYPDPQPAPVARPGRRNLDQGAGTLTRWCPELGRLVDEKTSDRISTRAPVLDQAPDIKGAPVWVPSIKAWINQESTRACPGYFLPGRCANGHRWAKTIVCGREWCPQCGAPDSTAHQRRMGRWLSKVRQISSMGYFVFTIPEDVRIVYRDPVQLRWLRREVRRLMQSHGFERGLSRWHWRGDQGARYHPHLNVLVDGGYLSEGQLTSIKGDYARLLGCSVVDVHYQYTSDPAKMSHVLRYVTRATMRDLTDGLMAYRLVGFRNASWWGAGRWSEAPVWGAASPVELLESHKCPRCEAPVEWVKPLPMSMLHDWERKGVFLVEDVGAGYYSLDPPDQGAGHLPVSGPDFASGRALLDLVTSTRAPGGEDRCSSG